jgi:hypothetical protein
LNAIVSSSESTSSYAALRLDLADVAGAFGGENWMSDPANWCRKHRYRADPRIGAEAVAKLRGIVLRLSDPDARVSPEAARLLAAGDHRCRHRHRHAFATAGTTETIASATRLIQNAEHYIEAAGRDLRQVRRVPPQPSSRIHRRARHRSGHLPSTQAAMRHPFGTS